MNQIFQNIRCFAVSYKAFFVLFHVCVFISSCLLFFSFGAYQNFFALKQGVENKQRECTVFFYDSDEQGNTNVYHATKKQMSNCIASFSDDLCKNIALFSIQFNWYANDGHTDVWSRFRFYDNLFYPYDESLKNLIDAGTVISGFEGISIEMYNSGKNIVETPMSLVDENNQVWLGNTAYEARIITMGGTIDMPFPTIPEETELLMLYIKFISPPSTFEYYRMKQVLEGCFGTGIRIVDPEPYHLEDVSYYSSIVMVSILIAFAASANIALLYHYIFEKRKRTLAIWLMCGCTKMKAFFLFMKEIFLLTAVTFVLSVLCYQTTILHSLQKLFPYIDTVDSVSMYCRSFIIFIGTCMVLIGIVCARSIFSCSIVSNQKEGFK